MNVRAMIGLIGNGGPVDTGRVARAEMERRAGEDGYRLHIMELTGDTRADADVYTELESRVRHGDVALIATWGPVRTGTLNRLRRAYRVRVTRLDDELSMRAFPFAYFSLSPQERRASVWARSVDELPGKATEEVMRR